MTWRPFDKVWVGLTALAALIIIAMLVLILGNITIHGWEKLSWEFISQAPRGGMTEGGVFPAMYGTTLLVLLMTIFVVPLGVLVAVYFSELPTARRGCTGSHAARWITLPACLRLCLACSGLDSS